MNSISFKKGSFCGRCRKSKEDLRLQSMRICSRCQIARYCSKECQRKDFQSHKVDCKWVGHFHDIMPRIEKNLRNWKEDGRSRPVNLFETQIGDFCDLTNRMYWDPPKSKLLKDIWPRDYMRRRCRMAEGMWEIARKHESYESTQDVLALVLATLRLDFFDRYAVKEMVVFMFLYLGREDDAFYFLKFWCGPKAGTTAGFMQRPTGKELGPEEFGSLPEGEWFHAETGNKLEDIFCKCCNPGPYTGPMGLLVALIGIKVRILLELKQLPSSYKLVNEMLTKEYCNPVCRKDKKNHVNGCNFANISRKEVIMSTKGQLEACLDHVNKHNPSMLPGLLHPKPLLAKPVPTMVNDAGPTGAHIVLINAWKYFDMLPHEGKQIISDFLFPKLPKWLPYPEYKIDEDERCFMGNMHYQTGYVRNYVNPNANTMQFD